MVHPTIGEVSGRNGHSQLTRGLSLYKDQVQVGLSALVPGVHLGKEAVVFEVPLILVVSVSELGLHIRLD